VRTDEDKLRFNGPMIQSIDYTERLGHYSLLKYYQFEYRWNTSVVSLRGQVSAMDVGEDGTRELQCNSLQCSCNVFGLAIHLYTPDGH
jgi:hypothetical protein